MSLKAFHLVFVTISTVLSLGFGIWALAEHRRDGERTDMLLLGIGALATCVALLVYGRWFLRKLKHLSYL
jgi:ABC-type anion transport system duplicated permease subunit